MAKTITRELSVVETRALDDDTFSIRVAQSDPEFDIENMDVERYLKNPVVLWNHDHYSELPVGRTKNLTRNADGSWDADFEFLPGDPFADRVKNAYKKGFINGASISFIARDDGTPIEMVEWSLVNVPADADALRKSLSNMFDDILDAGTRKREAPMTNSEIETLVKKTIDEHTSGPTYDKDAMGSAISEAVKVAVDAAVAAAMKERDEAQEQAQQAESEKRDAELQLQERAESRAELLLNTKGMLPTEFETRGKSERDILVAALGDRIGDVQSKSDEYLRARFDHEVELRSKGATALARPSTTATAPGAGVAMGAHAVPGIEGASMVQSSGDGNILSLIDEFREPTHGRPANV